MNPNREEFTVQKGTVYRISDEPGAAMRLCIDRRSNLPVISWTDRDDRIYMRRFNGVAWDQAVVLKTGQMVLPLREAMKAKHPAAQLAVDSRGKVELVMSDGKGIYLHTDPVKKTEAICLREFPEGEKIKGRGGDLIQVFARVDSCDRLHVAYQLEADHVGRLYHSMRNENGEWTAWKNVGEGEAHLSDVALGPDDTLHFFWIRLLDSIDGKRNWQAFYRSLDENGRWIDEERATYEKPVSARLGPIAVGLSAATDSFGIPYLAYPVDPKDGLGDDDGHAAYTFRDKERGWQQPQRLFTNARHAAWVKIAISSNDVKYVFGLNLRRRYTTDSGGGFGSMKYWHDAPGRWYFIDAVAVGENVWLAYLIGREWGPVEVQKFPA